jgi:tRNA A-37 threonylcarbamoyl transferase component Bud32/tetratricopeptide (TPR) repeat protein
MRHSDFDLASTPGAEPALARGTALGRFVVLGLVGRGAMGEVYAAYDPELDRKIAIKLLRARTGDAQDNRARLMREAKATAKISHPNVVVVYDAGTFGERVFIAMEFVEGHTLRFWLQAQERTWHEILDVFVAAGRGLAAAHDKELVHRDFKPDNVMITAQGNHVRVMDFGLARFVARVAAVEGPLSDLDGTIELGRDQLHALPPLETITTSQGSLTATGAVLGTPAYMSPEQFSSAPADAPSDQFSFCVALYEALYGQRPFAGRTLVELSENVVAGRLAAPAAHNRVPAWLRPVLLRGLNAKPEQRYPSMNALLDELARQSGTGRTSFARGAAAKLAGVWEPPVAGQPVESPEKAAMRAAFLATGKTYAAASFAAASAVLDRYAQRWAELYVEVCEATHVRGEQSAEVLDLRMTCLNEGLADLRALCRTFAAATALVVENAVRAATALGTLERCSDIKLLRSIVRPPEDAQTRVAVEVLRQRLVEVRTALRVGQLAAGLEAVVPLLEEARRMGYDPLTAEVLLTQGMLQLDATLTEAATVLEEAYTTAIQARHDEVAATAAVFLMHQNGYLRARPDAAEVWDRCAGALLQRLDGYPLIWGWYLTARACFRETQGRFLDAAADSKAAVAQMELALGPKSGEVAIALGNLANHMAFGGDFQGALEVSTRATQMFVDAMLPDHPRAALYRANRGQYLYRLSRIDEGLEAASSALVVLEREMGPSSMVVSAPLRTMGLCHLARGEMELAAKHFERALTIREAAGASLLRLAEVRAPLARALYARRAARARALALGAQALREYRKTNLMPSVARDVAELEAWLERVTKPAGKPAKRKARAGPKPSPRGNRRARSRA